MGEEQIIYFFDSYAILEVIFGNPSYSNYSNIPFITTKLNLMEVHFSLLKLYGKKEADEYYDELVKFAINFEDEAIKFANEFKLKMKAKNLSYIDCLGYIIAKLRGVKFLTGDKEFQDLENVEFVK